MLHKCSVFSNSSITRNLPTVDLVKNPDLVKFELLTKNFTKSGVYCNTNDNFLMTTRLFRAKNVTADAENFEFIH